jgi:hypothetical protein
MNPNSPAPAEAVDTSVMSPEQRKEFLEDFDADITARIEKLNRLHAPVSEGSAELARLFITLSGGALVATISIVQLISERLPTATLGWLLPASWILFGLTIVASIFSLGAVTGFRSLELEALSARSRLLADEGQSSPDEMILAVQTWGNHLQKQVRMVTSIHNISRVGAAVCLILAFAAVIAFAIANYPL